MQEFPYAEHYSLVKDHLRILTAQEEATTTEIQTESADKSRRDNGMKSGVSCADDDEEWSDDEEAEAEEETGMIVDAAP